MATYAVCAECGVFMNCDEIDAAYVPEQDEWTCGPCVRQAASDLDSEEVHARS